MLAKLLTTLTGRDDVERVAMKNDMGALRHHLRSRPLLIPRRALQCLDPAQLTDEQLRAAMEREAAETATAPFEPRVLTVEGQRRLPAFSSLEKLSAFSKRISTELNQVFALSAA